MGKFFATLTLLAFHIIGFSKDYVLNVTSTVPDDELCNGISGGIAITLFINGEKYVLKNNNDVNAGFSQTISASLPAEITLDASFINSSCLAGGISDNGLITEDLREFSFSGGIPNVLQVSVSIMDSDSEEEGDEDDPLELYLPQIYCIEGSGENLDLIGLQGEYCGNQKIVVGSFPHIGDMNWQIALGYNEFESFSWVNINGYGPMEDCSQYYELGNSTNLEIDATMLKEIFATEDIYGKEVRVRFKVGSKNNYSGSGGYIKFYPAVPQVNYNNLLPTCSNGADIIINSITGDNEEEGYGVTIQSLNDVTQNVIDNPSYTCGGLNPISVEQYGNTFFLCPGIDAYNFHFSSLDANISISDNFPLSSGFYELQVENTLTDVTAPSCGVKEIIYIPRVPCLELNEFHTDCEGNYLFMPNKPYASELLEIEVMRNDDTIIDGTWETGFNLSPGIYAVKVIENITDSPLDPNNGTEGQVFTVLDNRINADVVFVPNTDELFFSEQILIGHIQVSNIKRGQTTIEADNFIMGIDPENEWLDDGVNGHPIYYDPDNSVFDVQITDEGGEGCSVSHEIIIPNFPYYDDFVAPTIKPSCKGGSTGTITMNSSDDYGDVDYFYYNLSTGNASLSNLEEGAYDIKVSSFDGDYTFSRIYEDIMVTNYSEIEIANVGSSTIQPSCSTASNGRLSFNYITNDEHNEYIETLQLKDGDHYTSSEGTKIGENYTGLEQGTYRLMVQTNNGCIYHSADVVLNPLSSLVIQNITPVVATCNASNDGALSVTLSGEGSGTANVALFVGEEDQDISPSQNLNTYTFAGLDNIEYTIRASKNGICEVNGNASIGTNNPVTVSVPSSSNPSCSTGTDGLINFDYNLNGKIFSEVQLILYNGDGQQIINSSVVPATDSFQGMSAGSYRIRVHTDNDCYQDSEDIILQNSNPVSINVSSSVNPYCSNGTDGQISFNYNKSDKGFSEIQLLKETLGVFEVQNSLSIEGNTSFEGLGAGNYKLRLHTTNGCFQDSNQRTLPFGSTSSITISNLASSPASCAASADGSVSFALNLQGRAFHSAALIRESSNIVQKTINDQDNLLFNNIDTGTYRVRAYVNDGLCYTDANNTITVSEKEQISINLNVTSPTSCSEQNTGNLSYSKDMGGLTFSSADLLQVIDGENVVVASSNNNNVTSFSNLAAGEYRVRINSTNNNCSETSVPTLNVSIQAPLTISLDNISLIEPSCDQATDGFIKFKVFREETEIVNASAVSINYNGQTVSKQSGFYPLTELGIGDHEITIVETVSNCQFSQEFTLEATDEPLSIGDVEIAPANCLSSSDGTIEFSLSGRGSSSPAAVYISRSAPETQFLATHLGGSNYRVENLAQTSYTIHASYNGCNVSSTNHQVSFREDHLQFDAVPYYLEQPTCYESDGRIRIDLAGGTAPFNYVLQRRQQGIFQNYASGQFNNSSVWINDVGTRYEGSLAEYVIQVSDVFGCEIEITQPFSFVIPSKIQINPIADLNVSCKGGGVNVTIHTSNSPRYNHSVELFLHNSTQFGSAQNVTNNGAGTTFSGLVAGDYHAIGFDNESCSSDTVFFTVNEPQLPLAVSASRVTQNGTSFHVSCGSASDGQVIATPSGGWQSYTLTLQRSVGGAWENVASNPSNNTFSAVPALENELPINYRIRVSDLINCTQYSSVFTLNYPENQNTNPPVLSSFDGQNISCYGGNDGNISIGVTGGAYPKWAYLYTEPNLQGFIQEVIRINSPQPFVFNELSAGNYSLAVMDTLMLTNPSCGPTIVNSIVLTEPTIISMSDMEITHPLCNNDSTGIITITAGGGLPTNGQYTYQLYFANSIEVIESQFGASATFHNLPAGSYWIEMSGKYGCPIVYDNINLSYPPQLEFAQEMFDSPLCFGGTNGLVRLSAIGGTASLGSYSFTLWGNGIDERVLEGDSVVFDNLASGYYNYSVADQHQCIIYSGINLPERPDPLEVSNLSITLSTCPATNDASYEVAVSGGDAPYLFSTDNINYTESDDNTFTVSGLAGNGQYHLYVRDYNFISIDSAVCTVVQPVFIEATDPIVIEQETLVNVSCYGENMGSINVLVSKGTQNEDQLFDLTWRNANNTLIGNTSSITNLEAGNYNLVAKLKGTSCTATRNFNIAQPIAPFEAIIQSVEPTTCQNLPDGKVLIRLEGGWPYSRVDYSLNGGVPRKAILEGGNYFEVAELASGVYQMDIVASHTKTADKSNCSSSVQFTIANENIGLIYTKSDATCFNVANGSLQMSADKPGTSYNISIDGISFEPFLDNINTLSAGTYYVVGYQMAGLMCFSDTLIVEIEQPSALTGSVEVIKLASACLDNGLANVHVEGGILPYTFAWKDENDQEVNPASLPEGNYNVTIADAGASCILTLPFNVGREEGPIISEVIIHQADYCQLSIGQVQLVVSGGQAPYTYSWVGYPEQISNTISNVPSGIYQYSITDAEGCAFGGSIQVPTANEMMINVANKTNATCGESNGAITLEVVNGFAPYSIQWPEGVLSDGDLSAQGFASGQHTIWVQDAYGCSKSIQVGISNEHGPSIEINIIQASYCGLSNGILEGVITGGAGELTYEWLGQGVFEAQLGNVSAGIYTLQVTDENGCVGLSDILLTDDLSKEFTVQLDATPSACGKSIGLIEADAVGGQAPYLFEWSNGTSGSEGVLEGLPAGQYSVLVTDALGCKASSSIFLPDAPNPQLQFISKSASICGATTGEIAVNAIGGKPPYQYYINGSVSLQSTWNHLLPGIYELWAEDQNACLSQKLLIEIETQQVNLMLSALELQKPTCSEASDGMLQIQASHGTAPYSYQWSHDLALMGNLANHLHPGNYTIVVSDYYGCSDTLQHSLEALAPLSIALQNAENVSCYQGADGFLQVQASGGNGDYSYHWSNGQSGNTASSLAEGLYEVVVSNTASCQTRKTLTITQPDSLYLKIHEVKGPVCHGSSDASIRVEGLGGTGPYHYLWSNGQVGNRLSNVAAGNYEVLLTDAQGCQFSTSMLIPEKVAISISSILRTPPSCQGVSDGSISIQVSGAKNPSIKWSNQDMGTTLRRVPQGTYTVSIVDADKCFYTQEISLEDPELLEVTLADQQHVQCHGMATGRLAVQVSGGTGAYTYRWSNGATTSQINSLKAGSYSVTIKDAKGCLIKETYQIEQPQPLSLSTLSKNSPLCFGECNGEVSLLGSGGNGVLVLTWPDGKTGFDRADLCKGNYPVILSDANGCQFKTTLSISDHPRLLVSHVKVVPVSCSTVNDGKIAITAVGGFGPKSFVWSDGAIGSTRSHLAPGDYQVTISDTNGCSTAAFAKILEKAPIKISDMVKQSPSCVGATDGSISIQVEGAKDPLIVWSNQMLGNTLSNVPKGIYTVNIEDADKCNLSQSITLEDLPPLQIQLLKQQDVLCNGAATGSLLVEASGGNGAYKYQWSNGAKTKQINALVAGQYSLTVTDAKGCAASQTFVIQQAVPLQMSIIRQTSPLCYGDRNAIVDIAATGGTGPLTFTWPGGKTGFSRNDLMAGNYNIILSDVNGCRVSKSIHIKDHPQLNIAPAQVSPMNCSESNDASIYLPVSGGLPPYQINWSDGASGASRTGLAAGLYVATVSDANSCYKTAPVNVAEKTPIQIVSIAKNRPSCYDATDGSISIVVSGARNPLIKWSNQKTGTTIQGLSRGVYRVDIVDADNCSYSESIVLEDAPPMSLKLGIQQDVTCFGGSNGKLSVNALGGNGNYTYVWSNGARTQQISNLSAGSYSVTARDSKGCGATATFVVKQPDLLQLKEILNQSPLCFGACNGKLEFQGLGGTGNLVLVWSDGFVGFKREGLCAGNYTVYLSDQNGCAIQRIVQVQDHEPLAIKSEKITFVSCPSHLDGAIKIEAMGGSGSYAYRWADGFNGPDRTGLPTGTHTVSVQDKNGCSITAHYNIASPDALKITNQSIQSPSCYQGNNGSIQFSLVGGTSPYTFAWADGASSLNRQNLAAGIYSINISDSKGCTFQQSFEVIDPNPVIIEGLPNKIDLCAKGSMALDAGTWFRYDWSSSNGFKSQARETLVEEAGDYAVTVWNQFGCSDTHYFKVNVTEKALNTDFLLISEAFALDTLLFIDVSWPLPDEVIWFFDDGVQIIAGQEYKQEVIFPKSGIYDVAIRTTMDGCTDYLSKTISIKDPQGKPTGRLKDSKTEGSKILECRLVPNPSDGNITLDVLLDAEEKVLVKVYALLGNLPIWGKGFEGADRYTVSIDLRKEKAGMYLVEVITPHEIKIERFIKY